MPFKNSFLPQKKFNKFLDSRYGLEIYQGGKIIFNSEKSGVKGLLDFIKNGHASAYQTITIFDKIVGRGAALLVIYLKVEAIYGLLGSESAAEVLKEYKINFYFRETCRNILNMNKTDICPIEKLSFKKTPEEFLNIVDV